MIPLGPSVAGVARGARFTRCPKAELRDKHADDDALIQQYDLCRRFGRLPDAGGLFDQPARLLRAFRALDEVLEQDATGEPTLAALAQIGGR